VNWLFLLEVLEKRGFGARWMREILHRGFVGVTINNMEGEFFETEKGLRQGGLLSPILFNLVVDALSRMLQKATRANLIHGLGGDLIEGGVVT
jgi:retron-type reverse transcriptase